MLHLYHSLNVLIFLKVLHRLRPEREKHSRSWSLALRRCCARRRPTVVEFQTQIRKSKLHLFYLYFCIRPDYFACMRSLFLFLFILFPALFSSSSTFCFTLSKLPLFFFLSISVLILSPTRELAMQIAGEAEQLLLHHPFKVQCVYGGTNINTEAKRLRSNRADILVCKYF